MGKKILIMGGKFADIPTIKSARMLGYYVITSGNNPNDLGHNFSDKFILCDYSDMESMLKLAQDLKVDAIMSSCDDVSVLTCSYVSNILNIGNFDNLDIMKTIHHKDLWRGFLRNNNIPHPKAIGFSNISKAILEIPTIFQDSKIIIKPVDFATGKGINIALGTDNLYNKLKFAFDASKVGRIVVEEFIDGTNHGFSTILQDQKVVFYFCDDEQHSFNEFAVSGTTTSTKITQSIAKTIIEQIERIAKILNLKNGIFHTQILLHKTSTGDTIPFIIEACRRMGGDLYCEFVSQSCGIDYPSICIQSHNLSNIVDIFYVREDSVMGNINIFSNKYEYNGHGIISHHNPKRYFSRQCIMSNKTGIIKDIDLSLLRDFVTDSVVWGKSGDIIDDTTKYKAGIVFLEGKNMDTLNSIIDLVPDCINIY